MSCVTRVPRHARPHAEADILEVWGYIAEDSVVAADRWVDKLDEKFALWATQPMMGRARDELSPGIRSCAFGRYVVFFQPVPYGIQAESVTLSVKRLPARHFKLRRHN